MVLEPTGDPMEERGVRGERRGTALFYVDFVQKPWPDFMADFSRSVKTITKPSPNQSFHKIRMTQNDTENDTEILSFRVFVVKPMEIHIF